MSDELDDVIEREFQDIYPILNELLAVCEDPDEAMPSLEFVNAIRTLAEFHAEMARRRRRGEITGDDPIPEDWHERFAWADAALKRNDQYMRQKVREIVESPGFSGELPNFPY